MTIGWKNSSTRPAGRTGFGENPKVSSKGARTGARNGFTSSDPRQPSQPANLYRDEVAPGVRAKPHVDLMPPNGIVNTVGYDPATGKFLRPDYSQSMGKHGSGSFQGSPTSAPKAPRGMLPTDSIKDETKTDSP